LESEREFEKLELTFERRADTFLFAFPSADDGHQITRIKYANYAQGEGGDQQIDGELRDVCGGYDWLPCER
jgi:hypothetical protein